MLVAPKQTRIQSILPGSQASNRRSLNAESNRIDSYLKNRVYSYCTSVDDLHHEVVVDEVPEVFVLHLDRRCDHRLVLFVLLVEQFLGVLASLLVVLLLLVVELVARTQLKLVALALGVCLVLAVLACIVLAISVGIGLSP